jgi:hypothetical protein
VRRRSPLVAIVAKPHLAVDDLELDVMHQRTVAAHVAKLAMHLAGRDLVLAGSDVGRGRLL